MSIDPILDYLLCNSSWKQLIAFCRHVFAVKSMFSWCEVHIICWWIMGMWTLSIGFKWQWHSLWRWEWGKNNISYTHEGRYRIRLQDIRLIMVQCCRCKALETADFCPIWHVIVEVKQQCLLTGNARIFARMSVLVFWLSGRSIP